VIFDILADPEILTGAEGGGGARQCISPAVLHPKCT